MRVKTGTGAVTCVSKCILMDPSESQRGTSRTFKMMGDIKLKGKAKKRRSGLPYLHVFLNLITSCVF